MSDHERDTKDIEARLRISEERLRLAEASGIGMFELDLASDRLEWTPQVAVLLGLDSRIPGATLADWERVMFADDVPKVRAAIETAARTGRYHIGISRNASGWQPPLAFRKRPNRPRRDASCAMAARSLLRNH